MYQDYLLRKDRDHIIYVVTGRKGIGKTYLSEQLVKRYAQIHNKKVLIFAAEGKDWAFANTISKNQVGRFIGKEYDFPEILAIRDNEFVDLEEKEEVFKEVVYRFRNGLLVAEDLNKYLIGTGSKKIIASIVANRQKNADILLHFQSLAAVTPRIFQNAYIFRLHKQVDDITRYSSRIPEYKLFYIAKDIVDNAYKRGDKRRYVYVNLFNYKIEGQYKISEFVESAINYLTHKKGILSEYESKLSAIIMSSGKKLKKRITKSEIKNLSLKEATKDLFLHSKYHIN